MKFKGVFIMSYAYIGNTQFEVFDNHNNLIYSSIQSDFNIQGYCNCLCDMGYANGGWKEGADDND